MIEGPLIEIPKTMTNHDDQQGHDMVIAETKQDIHDA